MGLTWYEELLQNTLTVGTIAVAEHFLFRGCPDILIGKNSAATLGSTSHEEEEEEEEEESDTEDALVENSYQRNPMRGRDPNSLPEKVGEVFAGLYILLVGKIMRNLAKGKNVCRCFAVQGLLVDKVCGAVQCRLSVQVKEGAAALNFSIANTLTGWLEPCYLCTLVHKL